MFFNMFKPKQLTILLALSGTLVSHVVFADEHKEHDQQASYPVMAVPLQSTLDQEIEIAKLNKLLLRSDINDELKAKAYYQRARYYESVGLKDLARIDFGESLSINPRQPLIYNHLGVYFTQSGEFDAAYEAFDSTIDLDPSNQDALYNRAIALYYGGRYQLALEDIELYSNNNPKDPYSAIWYYLIESKTNKETAKQRLAHCYEANSGNWGWVIAGILLGEVSEEQALAYAMQGNGNNVAMAQRLTEVYFYLGKHKIAQQEYSEALSLYKLAISLNVFDYVEHGFSFLELQNIYQEFQKARKSGNTDKFVKIQ
ncbi:lipoprotein NlpI [Vibrio sp. HN007]|uniref:lipoprotein NlpI n=1 Tax=Vibrio iocasae TaxID=3098914 RepID=UPI0035D477FE